MDSFFSISSFGNTHLLKKEFQGHSLTGGALQYPPVPSFTREQLPYFLKNPCEVPAQLSRLKDPNIGQGFLVPVVIHLQLYLEVADVGTRGGTDELPGFQIRKILSLIYVLFLG